MPDGFNSHRLSNFPVKIRGGAGATLGDAPLPQICGGKDGSNYWRDCYVLHPQSYRWNFSGQLSEGKAFVGSATHPDHGWVIVGGHDDTDPKSSAEQTKDGKTFLPFASLPLPLAGIPGLVSLGKGGGRGDFFLAGGWTTGVVFSNKAFIYDAGSWREVANMPTARYGETNKLNPAWRFCLRVSKHQEKEIYPATKCNVLNFVKYHIVYNHLGGMEDC